MATIPIYRIQTNHYTCTPSSLTLISSTRRSKFSIPHLQTSKAKNTAMKCQLLETWPKEDSREMDAAKNNLELSLGIPLTTTSYRIEKIGTTTPVFAAPDDKHKRVLCFVGNNGTGAAPHQATGGSGSKRWFSDVGAGNFVRPWRLAARQQKIGFEQQHITANLRPPLPPSEASRGSQPAAVVGWPPVRASRKNLASPRLSRADMDVEEMAAKKWKSLEEDSKRKAIVDACVMFVKVNMEGHAVGRKINLLAHDGYESLSSALWRMFDSFLSVKHANNHESDELGNTSATDMVLLYEDNEGDRMLVGDVPWEMFLATVKRLYITCHSRTCTSVEGDQVKKDGEGMKRVAG